MFADELIEEKQTRNVKDMLQTLKVLVIQQVPQAVVNGQVVQSVEQLVVNRDYQMIYEDAVDESIGIIDITDGAVKKDE